MANQSLDPPTWLSQSSVRAALNVPNESNWQQCTSTGIFRNRTDGSIVPGDPYSAMPATNNLLARMIEYTGNVIIGSGGLDMLIPTNGTLLVLQNVTWGGVQGFQRRPEKPASVLFARVHKDYQR
jgi:carboxypeptidase D